MQTITPFLWFDSLAEEAARFYVSVFPDSAILSVGSVRDGRPGHEDERDAIVRFKLRGQEFSAINGGPVFQFTPAVSFVVDCTTQDEVDHYWYALTADGGEPGQCGWLTDRFGLSWQIVPNALGRLLGDSDAEKAKRVTEVMLGMKKLVIADLERAAEG